MADQDYLLEAALGALQGFQAGYVPHVEAERASRLKRRAIQDELELSEPFKVAAEERRRETLKSIPNYILDEGGNVQSVLGGGKVTKSKSTKSLSPQAKKDIEKTKTEYADAIGTAKPAVKELGRLLLLNEKASAGRIGQAKQTTMSALNLSSPTFEATADLVNSLQGMVAKVLKSTFGGQLSDGEREYLREVYGAASKYSTTERKVAINNIKRIFEDRISEKKTKLQTLSDLHELDLDLEEDSGESGALPEPSVNVPERQSSGLDPDQRRARIEELKAKRGR